MSNQNAMSGLRGFETLIKIYRGFFHGASRMTNDIMAPQ